MDKKFFILVNILIYATVIAGMSTMHLGSFGRIAALVVGGLLFAIAAFLVEPILKFFKFPINFWGLFFVGLLINLIFFVFFSLGLAPSILTISAGTFGSELSPIPFPVIVMSTNFVTCLVASVLTTLVQILTRKIA